MIINTQISYGYIDLLKIFFKANELDVLYTERIEEHTNKNLVTLQYEDGSDTAYNVTFMSIKHLGFENMLCDYLINCGIESNRLSVGRVEIRRDMALLDKQWEEHRKKIGLR